VFPQGFGGPRHDERCETGYEALRSAVLEGAEFHADKTRGLEAIITLGTAAWIKQCQGAGDTKAPPAWARSRRQSGSAGQLAALFANLVESLVAGANKKSEQNMRNEGNAH